MFILNKMLARNLTSMTGKRTAFFGLSRDAPYYHPSVSTVLNMLSACTIATPIKNVWGLEDIHRAQESGPLERALGLS